MTLFDEIKNGLLRGVVLLIRAEAAIVINLTICMLSANINGLKIRSNWGGL